MSSSLCPPCHVRVKSVPLVPITSEPPSLVMSGSPWKSSAGGSLPPSYHVIFTGGRAAARREPQLDDAPERRASPSARGSVERRRAVLHRHRRRQPELQTPEGGVEVVDAHVADGAGAEVPEAAPFERHVGRVVRPAAARGRARRPSRAPAAPAACPSGAPTPCGHQPAGRSVQTCSSRTSPSAPARITSTARRVPSKAWPCVPICVTTPVSRATRAISRASQMLCASGFSQ